MKPKVAGACSICDREVFEVVRRDPDTRQILQLGRPLPEAVRADFRMIDGTIASITFCADCASGFDASQIAPLWNRCKASWLAEPGGAEFLKTQEANGLLHIERIQRWSEIR